MNQTDRTVVGVVGLPQGCLVYKPGDNLTKLIEALRKEREVLRGKYKLVS